MSTDIQDVESKYQIAHTTPPPVIATSTIANPGPLGLCGFALTTFVLSLHNAGAGIKPDGPHGVVTGLAFFYGGLVQLLAGMWEFKTGNTFGATAFSSYGGFWLSFGLMFIPGAAVKSSYNNDDALYAKSVGYYLLGWTIFTGIMLIASHRSNVGLISLFFFLFITFIMLTAGKLNSSEPCTVAGGALGIVTAFIAWYNALSGLLTKQSSYFTLPIGRIN
ncbi:GPR1/FUN34/yaaH family-domain-containing protein [Cokeromyces recurvatus]|uniref:GPR1/FUN34/yaaH family-domain-containing protein n=1 Tax=Cokeromyces recurvatus TaxID=90255 RepID=UPI002220371C|nr:GPR1/FUN34/yaaH family-domain-containing protein [Cokeromyces recurvatus]KAI7903132.1 GPR1/FUN34/yaaH family-domain-containing protein [Cokeromyces recurvatus]